MTNLEAALLRMFLAHGTDPFNAIELDRYAGSGTAYDVMSSGLIRWVLPTDVHDFLVIITDKGLDVIRKLDHG